MGRLLFWNWAGAGILFLAGIGVELMPNVQSWLWSGIVWGIASIWAIVVFLYWLKRRKKIEYLDGIQPVAYPKTGQAPVNTPRIALAELHFPKVTYHIEIEQPNKPQIYIEPLLISTGTMILESAKVEIAGESIPCNDWRTLDLWPGGTYTAGTHCKVPDHLSKGEHSIRLLIYANKEWRASEWGSISYEPSTLDKEGSQS